MQKISLPNGPENAKNKTIYSTAEAEADVRYRPTASVNYKKDQLTQG